MRQCERCQRSHSGRVCGIPAGVTLGFGAVRRSISRTGMYPSISQHRPERSPKSTATLDMLLSQAQAEIVKVMDMLRKVPAEMEEYSLLLDREGKLNYVIRQLHQQIGVAKSK